MKDFGSKFYISNSNRNCNNSSIFNRSGSNTSSSSTNKGNDSTSGSGGGSRSRSRCRSIIRSRSRSRSHSRSRSRSRGRGRRRQSWLMNWFMNITQDMLFCLFTKSVHRFFSKIQRRLRKWRFLIHSSLVRPVAWYLPSCSLAFVWFATTDVKRDFTASVF